MSILSTKEQIEFLLLKNPDASTEQLAELIAERVDQCLAEARPRPGQRSGGDGLKQFLKGVGEAVAEQSRNQTREHAAQLAEQPVDDAPAQQPEVVQP